MQEPRSIKTDIRGKATIALPLEVRGDQRLISFLLFENTKASLEKGREKKEKAGNLTWKKKANTVDSLHLNEASLNIHWIQELWDPDV